MISAVAAFTVPNTVQYRTQDQITTQLLGADMLIPH